MIDKVTLKTLEFDKILEEVASFAVCDATKSEIVSLMPFNCLDDAKGLLCLTNQMYLAQNKYLVPPLLNFSDISEALKRATLKASLNLKELFEIAKLITAVRVIRQNLLDKKDSLEKLTSLVSPLTIERALEKEIFDTILEDGSIKSSASERLYAIRSSFSQIDSEIKEKFSHFLKSQKFSKVLQSNTIQERSSRAVLAVKIEYRNEVEGVVHDRSDSGATVFIEPLCVVELNNKLKLSKQKEEKEIERILSMLSKKVADAAENLESLLKTAILLDIIQSKMRFSAKIRGTVPALNSEGKINILGARHPLIDNEKVVPVDISVGERFRLLLISGSNMGGKTVSLKIVGLFCLMAASGIFIPAREGSEVAVFETVSCLLGDNQSIEDSLSTFSSHITSLKSIIESCNSKSLVLLDELGSGTDPVEGAALAQSTVEHLLKTGCVSVVTTHYSSLKHFALTHEKIENASMHFDKTTLKPTYKLLMGLPGESHALKIARSLSLDTAILDRAEAILSDKGLALDKILSDAIEIKAKSENELSEVKIIKEQAELLLKKAEQEKEKYQKAKEEINENARLEVRKIIASNLEQADKILLQMQSVKDALHAKQLRKKLDSLKYIDTESIEKREPLDKIVVGGFAYAEPLKTKVRVLVAPNKKGEVEIEVGLLKTKIKVDKLYKL